MHLKLILWSTGYQTETTLTMAAGIPPRAMLAIHHKSEVDGSELVYTQHASLQQTDVCMDIWTSQTPTAAALTLKERWGVGSVYMLPETGWFLEIGAL